jgi:peptidoglycan-associated lipoprotein
VALLVEGHCDERGTEEYNRSLGERRALALREALASQGVSPMRVTTRSFGEDRPAVPGNNESAYRQNRRGEFVVLTPK